MSSKTDKGTSKLKAPVKCVVEKEQEIHNSQVHAQVQHIKLSETAANYFISHKESQEKLPYEEQDDSFKSYNNVVKTKSHKDQWIPNNLNFDGHHAFNIEGKPVTHGQYCLWLLESYFITTMFRTARTNALQSVMCLMVAENAHIPVPFWLTHFDVFATRMKELSRHHRTHAMKQQDHVLTKWTRLEKGKIAEGDRIKDEEVEKYLTEKAAAHADGVVFILENMKVFNRLLDTITFLSKNGKPFRPGRDIIRRSVYVEPDKLVEGFGMNQFRPVYVVNQEGQKFQCIFPKHNFPQTKPSLQERLSEFYKFCQKRDFEFKMKPVEAAGGAKKGASPYPPQSAEDRPPSPPCDNKLRNAWTSEHSFVLGLQAGLASYGVEEDEWDSCAITKKVKTEDGGASPSEKEDEWDSCEITTRVKTEDGGSSASYGVEEDEWDSCVITTKVKTEDGGASKSEKEDEWDSCEITTRVKTEDGGSSSRQGGGAQNRGTKRKTPSEGNNKSTAELVEILSDSD